MGKNQSAEGQWKFTQSKEDRLGVSGLSDATQMVQLSGLDSYRTMPGQTDNANFIVAFF